MTDRASESRGEPHEWSQGTPPAKPRDRDGGAPEQWKGTSSARPSPGGTTADGRSQKDTVRPRVLAALAAVRDPELDEPITSLGFVASCTVSAVGDVTVRLRLPTYFCAPNFAFLMVADAYDAVAATEGVRGTEVVLEDHFASEAINSGVAARAGFARSFHGEAAGELDQLRTDFLRKAVLAGTDQVCRPLLAEGREPAELVAMNLGDVPPSAELDRLRKRRTELDLPSGPADALVIDPANGTRVTLAGLPIHLRRARLTRVGIEANTGICSGMLRHRYHTRGEQEEAS